MNKKLSKCCEKCIEKWDGKGHPTKTIISKCAIEVNVSCPCHKPQQEKKEQYPLYVKEFNELPRLATVKEAVKYNKDNWEEEFDKTYGNAIIDGEKLSNSPFYISMKQFIKIAIREAITKEITFDNFDWEEELDSLQEFDGHTGSDVMVVELESVRDFIRKTRQEAYEEGKAERDEFWKDQEMGKSSDCYIHCEEAKADERKKVVEEIEKKVKKYLVDIDFGNSGEHNTLCYSIEKQIKQKFLSILSSKEE